MGLFAFFLIWLPWSPSSMRGDVKRHSSAPTGGRGYSRASSPCAVRSRSGPSWPSAADSVCAEDRFLVLFVGIVIGGNYGFERGRKKFQTIQPEAIPEARGRPGRHGGRGRDTSGARPRGSGTL